MLQKLGMVLLAIVLCPIAVASPVDDCHSGFNAYVGAKPYILNPAAHDRNETRIVAVFEETESEAGGAVPYLLTFRSATTGEVVATRSGSTRLEPRRQAGIETTWDGRAAAGEFVPDGEYVVTATAYFLEGDSRAGLELDRVDPVRAAARVAISTEARIVVDREGRYDILFDEAARAARLREMSVTGGDPTFPFDFYFGVLHSHSSWSDGGMPTTDCTSGRYGYAGGATPADAFDYAKTSGSIDFLAVNEHNHLMQEACSGCSATDVLNRYASAWTAAQSATVPGSFVGLWGMEWGVISGGGHVNVYNQQQLMSWAGEPFDVETPKSNYTSLYTAMAANQGTLGAFGTFNHPNSSDFGNWQRSPDGDATMRGLSVISGPAFSTSTSFTPGGSTYTTRFNQALSVGWKVAPEAHQDNHCWNYGNSTPNRTVAVVPSGMTFDQTSLVSAIGARRIYASQDRDAQLRFGAADGAFVMGASLSAAAAVSVTAGIFDPAAEGVQKIEVWGGRAGDNASPGASPTVVASVLASASLSASLTPRATGEEWYYYVLAVQADGDTLWSAPIWITWTGGGGSGDTTPPSTAITSPLSGATLSGTVVVTASASDDVALSRVEFHLDGALVATDSAAPYEWSWNTAATSNGAHTIFSRAVDTSNNTADSAPVSVTVSNDGGSGGTSADVSGWILEQANSAYQYVIPAGTTIPAGGYLVIARDATQSAFETFWGRTLGSNVVYLSSGNQMAMNGAETYTIRNAASAIVDGPSIAAGGSAGQSINRTDYCGSASSSASWNVLSSASGSPGTNAAPTCNGGVRIAEFSDATGTGNYIYEFVEIYNDSALGDTTAPTTSITSPTEASSVSGSVAVTADASDDTGVTSVEFYLDGLLAATDTTAPYSWSWDTQTASNGPHSLTSKAYDEAGNAGLSAAVSVTVDNDTTAPVTSVTSPMNGSTVSGIVAVTADASDDKGVARVEFFLDGALAATDTTAPYSWAWDTTTATDGAHTIFSRAVDTSNNTADSAPVSVTVSNDGGSGGTSADVSGWILEQANSAYQYVIPAGTIVPAGGYLVIARDATQTAFETFWGQTLGSNVVYLSSGNQMAMNGAETYTIRNAASAIVDGPSIAAGGSAGQSINRTDYCGSASSSASWNVLPSTSGSPGTNPAAGCNAGVRISEFSDATGTGNYIYEFVEIYNDSSSSGDTTAPTTSVTSPAEASLVSGSVTVTADASDDTGVTSVEFYLDGALAATDTTAPYSWSWNTLSAANGNHSLTSRAYDTAGNVGISTAVSVTVDNDTTAPVTSVTSPANGATVSGSVTVTADASDDTGVTSVEFYLDGALAATDSTAPYSWSWDTLSAANGNHSLTSRAYDAAGHVGISAAVSATVDNAPVVTGTDISGWRIVQANASATYYLPAGTVIPAGGYVIVGRNATKAAFEAYWGVTLGANVVYVDSGDSMPLINGSEKYTLYNASGNKRDGATVAMSSSGGQSLQRVQQCGNAGKASSWNRVAAAAATPGSGALAPCGKGIYIGEFSDTTGTGNFVYEFIELIAEN